MTAEEFAAMERRARMFEAANEKMLADNKRLREENARLREEISRLTLAFVEAEKKAERDYLRLVDADREEIERLRNDLKNAIFSDIAYTKEIERQDVLLREENARLREALDDAFAQWDGDWPEELVARVKAAIADGKATGGP